VSSGQGFIWATIRRLADRAKVEAMPKLPSMTVPEVEAILERAGFVFRRQTGHRIWRHPDGRGVSIPPHRGDLKPGTLRSIVEQTEMTEDEFLKLR
jgi:predicted RNA binding protein YcfA (HicA-like mRNA interferase family)